MAFLVGYFLNDFILYIQSVFYDLTKAFDTLNNYGFEDILDKYWYTL